MQIQHQEALNEFKEKLQPLMEIIHESGEFWEYFKGITGDRKSIKGLCAQFEEDFITPFASPIQESVDAYEALKNAIDSWPHDECPELKDKLKTIIVDVIIGIEEAHKKQQQSFEYAEPGLG